MTYNNIQSFIADLDERMQELQDYKNRRMQREAIAESSQISSQSKSTDTKRG